MIGEVVKFLRERLNKALPRDSDGAAEDLFVYVGADKDDAVSFKAGAISLLLIRIEEESVLRPADRYARVSAEGARQKVEPEIRLNLYLLFVARFPDDYGRALQHLSGIIRYFQNHRVFNAANSPELKEDIAQLVVELLTPSFSEQNEIWGSLRSAYQPSALYKVKMVVFQDEDAQPLTEVKELLQTVAQVRSR
jgi:Pvc16 N-terminal domain